MVRMLPLVLFFAAATLISAGSPGSAVDPTAEANMDAVIGGSVAGGVAVAAGIAGIVGWEESRGRRRRRRRRKGSDGGRRRRRKDSDGGRRRRKGPNSPEEACTPFTNEETCPTPECVWNATSSSCSAVCSDFTKMAACPAVQCTWTGTLCVDTINGRVVVPSNETAASSSSASSSNPWLWVGLALLACALAICTAAALMFCCAKPAKKPKKSAKKVVAPEPAAPAEPEVVLPELAPLMSLATPVAAPVYMAAPVTTSYVAAPVTTSVVYR